RDEVAGTGSSPANEVAVGGAGEEDAVAGVGQGVVAGAVGADEVAEHLVPLRTGVGDLDAVAENRAALVGGDDVAGRARGAADGVVGGADVDHHAAAGIAQGQQTAGIGADEVAGDHVIGGAGLVEADAERAVARDEVALQVVGDAVGVGADAVEARVAG